MKHSHHIFVQRKKRFNKHLKDAVWNVFTNNVHIYRFYFITSVVVILILIVLLIFIADYVKLKLLVTALTISRIPQVEAGIQTKSKCNVYWYIYLAIALLLGNCLVVNIGNWKPLNYAKEYCLQMQSIIMCFWLMQNIMFLLNWCQLQATVEILQSEALCRRATLTSLSL